MPLDDRVIAISATFTAEAIQPGLAFWAAELGLDYEIRFAGYNQLFQELLDPAGLFAPQSRRLQCCAGAAGRLGRGRHGGSARDGWWRRSARPPARFRRP